MNNSSLTIERYRAAISYGLGAYAAVIVFALSTKSIIALAVAALGFALAFLTQLSDVMSDPDFNHDDVLVDFAASVAPVMMFAAWLLWAASFILSVFGV